MKGSAYPIAGLPLAPTDTVIGVQGQGVGKKTVQYQMSEIGGSALAGIGFVSIANYGAIGDGSSSSSLINAAALNTALATGLSVAIPYTPLGYNFGTAAFTVPAGQFVFAIGALTICYSQSTTWFLGFSGSQTENGAQSGMQGLLIDMTGAGGSSTIMMLLTGAQNVGHTRVRNCQFQNFFGAITQQSTSHYCFNNYYADLEFYLAKGQPVKITNSQGFQRWAGEINIDGTTSATGAYFENWTVFEYDDFQGLDVDHVDHTGQVAVLGGGSAYNVNVISFRFTKGGGTSSAFAWGMRFRSEGCTGSAFQFSDCNFIHLGMTEAYGCLGPEFVLTSCNYIIVGDLIARGARDETGTVANADGVTLIGCQNCQIDNLTTTTINGNGLTVSNTSNLLITNWQSNNNIGWDVQESSGSNNNRYLNANLAGTGLGVSTGLGAASTVVPVPIAATNANTFTQRQTFGAPVAFTALTVATLPSAATSYLRTMVSDGSVVASGNFGAIVAGGGANRVPVFSDGTNWRIG